MIYTVLAFIRDISPDQIPEKFNREKLAGDFLDMLLEKHYAVISPFWPVPMIRNHRESKAPSAQTYMQVNGPWTSPVNLGYFYIETDVDTDPRLMLSGLNDLPGFQEDIVFISIKKTDDPEMFLNSIVNAVYSDPDKDPNITTLVKIVEAGLQAREDVESMLKKSGDAGDPKLH